MVQLGGSENCWQKLFRENGDQSHVQIRASPGIFSPEERHTCPEKTQLHHQDFLVSNLLIETESFLEASLVLTLQLSYN